MATLDQRIERQRDLVNVQPRLAGRMLEEYGSNILSLREFPWRPPPKQKILQLVDSHTPKSTPNSQKNPSPADTPITPIIPITPEQNPSPPQINPLELVKVIFFFLSLFPSSLFLKGARPFCFFSSATLQEASFLSLFMFCFSAFHSTRTSSDVVSFCPHLHGRGGSTCKGTRGWGSAHEPSFDSEGTFSLKNEKKKKRKEKKRGEITLEAHQTSPTASSLCLKLHLSLFFLFRKCWKLVGSFHSCRHFITARLKTNKNNKEADFFFFPLAFQSTPSSSSISSRKRRNHPDEGNEHKRQKKEENAEPNSK
jgi:hypothetical protein